MELAKADIPRHLWTNMNTPDLEQSEVLRPGETLEDWDVTFRRPNADGGVQQLVTPSVDGSRPGYQGRPLPIDPGSRSESLKRFLPKDKSKYISLTELRNLLGLGAEDMRAMGGSKDTVVARAAAKLLDQTAITGPGRDRPSTRNYFFYKKPTAKELELLKTYIDARPIQADMFKRIKDLQKDKYTAQILKDGKLPMVGEGKQKVLDPEFMKHVRKNYETLDKYVYGLVRYTQALDGQTIIGLNDSILSDGKFKTNKKIANKIRNVFLEMPYGSDNASMNTIRKAVYKSAMLDITNELGNTNATFEQWKDRIRRKIDRTYKLKGANIHIDELIGVSSSMRNKTAPYSVFTQLATKELNEGILKDYQKVLSNHTAKLKTEIGKNSKFVDGKWFHSAEAKKIVKNFNETILPNLKNIDQLKGTGFTLPEMTLGAPTDKTLGGVKGRLATLEKAGLGFKEFYQAEGFGYKMPKNVATQKELFTQLSNTDNVKKFKKTFSGTFQNLSPQSVLQLARKHGCIKRSEGGSAITCLQTKFKADPEKFLQRSAPIVADGKNANMLKWFKKGRMIARGTGVLALWEAAFAPVIAAPMYSKGESAARIWNEIAYGIPFIGETEKEELIKYLGDDAYKLNRFMEIGGEEVPTWDPSGKKDEYRPGELDYLHQNLELARTVSDAIKKSKADLARGPVYMPFDYNVKRAEDKIKKTEQEQAKLWNELGLTEGPAGKYLNWQKVGDVFSQRNKGLLDLAMDKHRRRQERIESGIVADPSWRKHINRYMGGGMVGIRKPHAIPPERQGLRSIMINGKKS
jgi:hypothetical protein